MKAKNINPRSRSSQGHDLYINFVELQSLMLNAKFQNHGPSGLNVLAIYSHLGHVTLTIYINFHSPFLRMLHRKFGFDWPSGFSEKDL